MKKLAIAAMIAASALLTGCGPEKINGVEYQSFGIVNRDEVKNPKIHYELSTSSVIFAIILSETIFVPIYILGWDLFEPVGPVNPDLIKGEKYRPPVASKS